MIKIGIITLVRVNNYGAELQAFATQHFFHMIGYDAEIIDYQYFINPRHVRTKGSRPSFKISFKRRMIARLYPFLLWYKRICQDKDALKKRSERFASFHSDNTKFSIEYRTAESLIDSQMDYDVYVVGSDQVWNPNNYTSLDPYFLRFAPQDKVRISYASSFGVSSLPDYSLDYYRKALSSLNAVSVREENALRIVNEIAGIKAQWVLDPTLLLTGEEWKRFGKPVDGLPEAFVLIYEVTPCAYLKSVAFKIADDLGCKVVRINRDAMRQESDDLIINVMDAGPAEFVWLFSKARAVVTNSFHGTAFSLNMQKDFLVVTTERKDNNSRQRSLLRSVHLENNLIVDGTDISDLDSYHVNYKDVNPLLQEMREISVNYLKRAIDGE